MFLGDYFNNIKNNYKKFFFSGISFNSNQVKKNNIFFAIKGNKVDGNNFILSAIKNGAKIIARKENFLPAVIEGSDEALAINYKMPKGKRTLRTVENVKPP